MELKEIFGILLFAVAYLWPLFYLIWATIKYKNLAHLIGAFIPMVNFIWMTCHMDDVEREGKESKKEEEGLRKVRDHKKWYHLVVELHDGTTFETESLGASWHDYWGFSSALSNSHTESRRIIERGYYNHFDVKYPVSSIKSITTKLSEVIWIHVRSEDPIYVNEILKYENTFDVKEVIQMTTHRKKNEYRCRVEVIDEPEA